jgi:hypothetical protein
MEIFSATGFNKILVPAKRTITRFTEEPRAQREKPKAQNIGKRFSRPFLLIDIKFFLFFGWIPRRDPSNTHRANTIASVCLNMVPKIEPYVN